MTAMAPDYHIHTCLSDGEGEMACCVERAIELGLPEIGFSDHLVPPSYDHEGYGIGLDRLDDYVAAVLGVRRRYPEMAVLLGVEVDYIPSTEDEMAEALARHRFDYVLGSVHFVEGFGFDETRNREHDRWRQVDEIYRGYYQLVRRAAASRRFTVMSHFDLPKKFGYRPAEAVTAFEDEALQAMAAADVAIEINTSGLRSHPVREMYPSPDLLERARRLGIALTFGSDAHKPDEVGSHFGQAVALARQTGYESYLRLSDGCEVPLP